MSRGGQDIWPEITPVEPDLGNASEGKPRKLKFI